jgi:hypothetical protein
VHERAHRLFRRRMGRDRGIVQTLDAGADPLAPHPRGEDRLCGPAGDLGHRPCGRERIAARLGGEDDQDRVDRRIGQHNLGRLDEPLRQGVVEQIDRIDVRSWRQGRVQPRDRLAIERREDTAAHQQRIGGDDGRTARVGQDRQPRPPGQTSRRQELGDVEDIVELARADHARALEGGPIDRVLGHHGAGARGCNPGGLAETAGLVSDDRLGAGEGPCGRHEPPGVTDRLDVENDRAGVRLAVEVVDEIAKDIEQVADGNERRKADALLRRPVDDGVAEPSGLRNEGDVADQRPAHDGAGVQIGMWRDDTERIGADDPEAIELGRDLPNCPLHQAAGLAHLAKPLREDHRARDAGLAARAHQVGHRLRGPADQGEIERVG